MKPALVDDAKDCWRWLSVQIPALNLAFLATWAMLPAKFQDALPAHWVVAIAAGLLVLGVLGRLIKQDRATEGEVNQ
jgi:hypothetical protein